MGSRCYQAGVSDQHYPTVADAVRDLAAIVRDEVVSLNDEGVPYIQLDAPGYTAYVDDVQRERMRANGNDPDLLFSEIVEADSSTIQGLRREGPHPRHTSVSWQQPQPLAKRGELRGYRGATVQCAGR